MRIAILLARTLNAQLTVLMVLSDYTTPLALAVHAPEMAQVAAEYQRHEREQFLKKFAAC